MGKVSWFGILSTVAVFFWNISLLAAQSTAVASVHSGAAIQAGWPNGDSARYFAGYITEKQLEAHVYLLASDSLEGRETGRRGQRKAAEYLAYTMENAGLQTHPEFDGYFQHVPYYTEAWNQISIVVNGKEYSHMRDFLAFPANNPEAKLSDIREVIFLGYGIDDEAYSDYAGVDVAGKVILIYPGEPTREGVSFITGELFPSAWTTDWTQKLKTAFRHDVAAVLIIDGDLPRRANRFRRMLIEPNYNLGEPPAMVEFPPHMYISGNLASDIMGRRRQNVIEKRDAINADGVPQYHKLRTRLNLRMEKDVERMIGENVMGIIPGTDTTLKGEYIFLTAHYDHLGIRGDVIFNGADDNASGTSALLEIGRAMAAAEKAGIGPRRSVAILLVAGEEKGLLGSQWFTDYPVVPLEQIVAAINIDMIGRIDDRYKDDPDYIYVIGSDKLSTDLHEINEQQNDRYKRIPFDYTYNDDDDPNRFYYRSDHYNFARFGIPVIFFFSGTHKDYHRPGDTADKILYDRVERVARHAFYVVWDLSMRDERIEVDRAMPVR